MKTGFLVKIFYFGENIVFGKKLFLVNILVFGFGFPGEHKIFVKPEIRLNPSLT